MRVGVTPTPWVSAAAPDGVTPAGIVPLPRDAPAVPTEPPLPPIADEAGAPRPPVADAAVPEVPAAADDGTESASPPAPVELAWSAATPLTVVPQPAASTASAAAASDVLRRMFMARPGRPVVGR